MWEEGFKTTTTAGQIARAIKTAHARNANFPLNVGPDKQGRIIESSRKVLARIPQEEIIRSTQVPGFLLHRAWLDPENLPDVAACLDTILSAK